MIVVTGGTGLVGSHLLYDLVKQGKPVRALKRAKSDVLGVKKLFHFYAANAEDLFSRIEWVEGDVLDIYSLLDAIAGATYVYHCAAVVSFTGKDAELQMKINMEGTANVVNACLEQQIKKLCYVSSVAALGATENNDVFTESLVWKSSPQHSVYAISKYAAEREVWRGAEEGLDVVIVNPSVIIGPGNWDKSSSLLFKQSYAGMYWYTDGSTGFVDVRDVVKTMIQLTESEIKNERYIVSAENLPYKLFFSEMAKAFSKPAPRFKAVPLITAVALKLEFIKAKLLGAEPRFTKEIRYAVHQQRRFSNDKLTKALNFQFIAIADAIKHAANLYLKK